MPAARCTVIGIVEQWYSHTPAWSVVIGYSRLSLGAMVRMTWSGATRPACMSREWPMEPWLTSSTVSLAPSSERRTGPTTVPPKVIASSMTPGAISSAASAIPAATRWSPRRR